MAKKSALTNHSNIELIDIDMIDQNFLYPNTYPNRQHRKGNQIYKVWMDTVSLY